MRERAIEYYELFSFKKVDVQIYERKIKITAHNTWRNICKPQIINLQNPIVDD